MVTVTTVKVRERYGAVGRLSADQIADLSKLAAIGNRDAWSRLVEEFKGLLWAIAKRHRLSDADAADVTQTTWLRLAENLDRLQDHSRVGAWLATTARRECLRTLRTSARELPNEEPPEPSGGDMPPVDRKQLEEERDAELWAAFGRLAARDQALLQMLIADPQPSYEEIGAALEMPIGSIGPTRGRALERLRRELKRSPRVPHAAARRWGAGSVDRIATGEAAICHPSSA
jgi:RNA polymerase sigma factor (sigma-70 family)